MIRSSGRPAADARAPATVRAWPRTTSPRSTSRPTSRPPTSSSSRTSPSATATRRSPGRIVEVHYVGVAWKDGKQFDASWDRGDTFKFGLGKGQVIPGWDQGVAGMKVGGRRRITIPPQLAYGKRGAGGVIGPDETLVFVVDLVGVR